MRNVWLWAGLVIAVLLLGACYPTTQTPAGEVSGAAAVTSAAPSPVPALSPGSTAASTVELLPPEDPPGTAARQFSTDFSKHVVPYSEILSGGPPKDGIPAIDAPKFVRVAEADAWLGAQEPVILVQVGDDVRAYPLQILIWHEIANDSVGGMPVTVTFCPLCNTAIAFERTLDGRVLDFGTTGRLRFSNLIMYDRQTESWWQQAEGLAIAGELVGRKLTHVPASIIAWADFKAAYPDGQVLSRETGYARSYGQNPYVGYDAVDQPPFLYVGPATPDRMPPMARVATVDLNGVAVAYPYDVLREVRVVNDGVGDVPVVIFWASGTASALDTGSVARGRDVGTVAVFSPLLDGRKLTFHFDGAEVVDEGTGSRWDVLGRAVSGPLAGAALNPIVSINHFWFSWAAFRPDTRVYAP